MARTILRSIRWTLQIWYASLLAAVLVGFGLASYSGISRMRYQEVDADLEHTAQLLSASMFPPGPAGADGRGPDGRGNDGRPLDGRPFDGRPFDGRGRDGRGFDIHNPGDDRNPDMRPRDQRDDPNGPPPDWHGPWRGRGGPPFIEVPSDIAYRFSNTQPDGLYYVGWGGFGEIIGTSLPDPAARAIPAPEVINQRQPEPPFFRYRGDVREVMVYGPRGTRVLVGRSIVHDESAMRNLGWMLGAVGGAVLLLGLFGGWLISSRAVRPIHAITGAAREISATNLSRRIDVAGTQSELGSLATVLNDMFARLDAAFQQQVRFTADASHELRTPLSVIHTHSQLALSKERSAQEYRKTIETSLRASGRMKGLVDSLLLLAGADAGRLKIEKQAIDLRDVVEDCLTLLAPLAEEKTVTVESDLHPTPLSGDPTRISQVAVNLLTNAIRYNRQGGKVAVAVKSEGPEAVLTISDTGVGIAAEHLPHLFERFYRVDVARSREAGGSGLGLAICKSIVEAHGGTISVQSEVEKGTVFTVRLPRDAMLSNPT